MPNPLKAQLHIFQLEGYSPKRFLMWWLRHPITYTTSNKKPLVYTFKVKLIFAVSAATYLIILAIALKTTPFLFLPFVLLFQPFILYFFSLFIIKPYEIVRRFHTVEQTRKIVYSLKPLTVIGITGSFGKTTTKDILFEILNHYRYTLKTPESYNTVFGISKVVNFELTKKHRYFICEMGAYVRGEIKELTHMIPPHFAILTAIGSQHLERFKSLKNTTLAKFELVDAVPSENALVNLDNQYIREHLLLPRYRKVKTFSINDNNANYHLTKYELNRNGLAFSLQANGKIHDFSSSLFGSSNLQDLVAAISLSLMLRVPPQIIKEAVKKLTPSPHRLQLIQFDKSTLIDNAYSTNEQGFENIINDLKNIPGKKALITPGIIELGGKTAVVHQKIGRIAASVFDTVVLVGKSDRTANLEIGLTQSKSRPKIQYLQNGGELWPEIDILKKTHDWILLENDLPDNF